MSPISWSETHEGFRILDDEAGDTLGRYSLSRTKNHPFFYELRSLQGQGVVTNHAPWDHRWHHGLWWSWKFVNDVLFWEDHPDYGGNRVGLGRANVEEHNVSARAHGFEVVETLFWVPDGRRSPLLTEKRCMVIGLGGVPGRQSWFIDWDMVWTAEEDVKLQTTPFPENSWGGYAGLNYRAARSMAAEERVLASGGIVGAPAVHGQRVGWAAYTGCLDGAEVDEPKHPAKGGIAIIEHPQNPGHPNTMYAWSALDGFGFLAAAPLMRSDLSLAAGANFRLCYRTIILGAEESEVDLSAAQSQYAPSN